MTRRPWVWLSVALPTLPLHFLPLSVLPSDEFPLPCEPSPDASSQPPVQPAWMRWPGRRHVVAPPLPPVAAGLLPPLPCASPPPLLHVALCWRRPRRQRQPETALPFGPCPTLSGPPPLPDVWCERPSLQHRVWPCEQDLQHLSLSEHLMWHVHRGHGAGKLLDEDFTAKRGQNGTLQLELVPVGTRRVQDDSHDTHR